MYVGLFNTTTVDCFTKDKPSNSVITDSSASSLVGFVNRHTLVCTCTCMCVQFVHVNTYMYRYMYITLCV